MPQKILMPKQNQYDDEYHPNKGLFILLAIGYPCLIIYFTGYFYNLASMMNHIGGGSSVTVAYVMGFSWFGFIITFISSQILLPMDLRKLKVGVAYTDYDAFNSITWGSRRWTWMNFLFWWFIFPLYIYRRKMIYKINRSAYEKHGIEPKPIVIFDRGDAVLAAILAVIIIISLVAIQFR